LLKSSHHSTGSVLDFAAANLCDNGGHFAAGKVITDWYASVVEGQAAGFWAESVCLFGESCAPELHAGCGAAPWMEAMSEPPAGGSAVVPDGATAADCRTLGLRVRIVDRGTAGDVCWPSRPATRFVI
jgi:hypothetical protein